MMELRTILLVEDNPLDAELTVEALAGIQLANRVIIVQDGVEALEFLRGEGKFKSTKPVHPAVIMLDIKLPRMDGIETLEAIRKDEKLKNIPVVMLTSSKEEPDLRKCYNLNVNAYVVKPVEIKQFINAIRQLGIFWGLINELPPGPC